MRHTENQAQVVRFWQAIEMFSPQSVAKPSNSESSPVLDVSFDEIPPWDARHPLMLRRPKGGFRRHFTVYGGLYELKDVRNTLLKVFGDDGEYVDSRVDGQSAMFAFCVDDEGGIIENSAVLSACGWAIGQALQDEPGSLTGFEDEQRAFTAVLNKLAAPTIKAAVLAEATGKSRSAAVDAAIAGAGAAAKALVQATLASVTGGAIAGVAGTVAGTFVERVLKPTAPGRPSPTGGPSNASMPGLTAEALHVFVRDLARQLGIAEELRPRGIRVKCAEISARRAGRAADQDFLNSFIVGDLSDVADALSRADAGAGLTTYLTGRESIRVDARVDVRRDPHAVVEAVAPGNIPAGRWPAGLDKSLALSQQFAVDRIMEQLRDGAGIFAVNGPPGTGKTTMLRDVVAALVVERARRLAELTNPLDAFKQLLPQVRTDGYVPKVWRLAPELTGFEIVVASSNNAAVANVTTEIPGREAVDHWMPQARQVDYFARLASHVFEREAWGLVAGQLGNMEHRTSFVDRFWWSTDPDHPGAAGTEQKRPNYEERRRNGFPAFGMQDLLEEAERQPPALDWREARRDFRAALTRVETLMRARQEAAEAFAEIDRRLAELQTARDRLAAADARCAELRERRGATEQWTLIPAVTQFESASRRLDDHQRRRPGFWVTIWTLGRAARDWHQDYRRQYQLLQAAEQQLDDVRRLIAGIDAELGAAEENRRGLSHELAQIEPRVAAVQAKIDHARTAWPGRIPSEHVADDERFQLCAPWADEVYSEARSRLFFKAMQLHKTFALLAAPRLRGNLNAAASIVKGDGAVFSDQVRLAAWQSLFLLVPVVSTTFASLPRLFARLGREALGWLFIDEAGQAAPQQAVGGIWRARRTVVVGDPQQLEPINSLPFTAQQALRRAYGVSPEWVPEGTSVQGVADRTTRYGTYLPGSGGGGEPVWVGAPLRVHRRCDRPMFEISNRIAYGGDLMIYGTHDRGPFYGSNGWIDVDSSLAQGNWVPAEGEALLAVIGKLLREGGVDRRSIRVISPFRHVVDGSKRICHQALGEEFARDNVGTVHTVQGKEADIVILVLGADPENHGARRWASKRPNLLNVAVSRARRRLYVVGNHRLWSTQPYFTSLAAQLDTTVF